MSGVEQISEKVVVARKPHECSTCGGLAVEVGQTYERVVLKFDGSLYTWIMCRYCKALSTDVYDWSSDPDHGIGTDEYDEWAEDLKDDPKLGGAARAYLARREAGR